MTFYLSPTMWWWGGGFLTSISMRWSLIGALVVAASVFINWQHAPSFRRVDRWFVVCLALYVVNGFFVNALLADLPEVSSREFDLLWKTCGLAVLFKMALWKIEDLHIVMMAIMLLSAFIGYSVIMTGAGDIERGRLEGLNFPGASGSNGAAAILIIAFPIVGYFFITNPIKYSRIIALLMAPLILDTVLRCNSRGAYLGAAVSGVVIIMGARGPSRRYAVMIMAAGILAFFIQAQDGKIWERLISITVSAEERDKAASGRIEYWKAGVRMISDYPLGSGGRSAFTSPRGMSYLQHLNETKFRSVHNGYLSIIAGWGIQGFTCYAIAMIAACQALWRSLVKRSPFKDPQQTLLGACILGALCGQGVCAMFGDYLDGEWFVWLAVFGLVYDHFNELSDAHGEADDFDDFHGPEWVVDDDV